MAVGFPLLFGPDCECKDVAQTDIYVPGFDGVDNDGCIVGGRVPMHTSILDLV